MSEQQAASMIQLYGAGCFGALIGWYIYYINRYRAGDVEFNDLITLIGIIGGGIVLTLFPTSTDLFGAYGIGLAVGFFAYFFVLSIFVNSSPNFDVDYFIDGRRIRPKEPYYIPQHWRLAQGAMGEEDGDKPKVIT